MVTAGILFGLGAALFQSLSYVFTRLFLARTGCGSPSLLAMGHVIMGVVSAVALPLLWPGQIAPLRAFAGPLLMTAGFYLTGQACLFFALSRTDASRISPLLGLKIVMLAAITTLLMSQPLSPWQWAAVGLSVAAAFVLNAAGGRLDAPAAVSVLLACAAYAVSDLSIKALIDAMAVPSRLHASVVGVCMCYILCGVAGAGLLLRARPKRAGDWVRALPFAASWLTAMVLLFATFATVGVVFGNIVQSTRGLISVALGAMLARAGLLHIEQRITRGALTRRLAAAALMCAAIALFLLC